MKKLMTTLVILLMTITFGMAQTRTVKRTQKGKSWEHYQANYKRDMLKDARELRKSNRKARRAERKEERFLARIERIKSKAREERES